MLRDNKISEILLEFIFTLIRFLGIPFILRNTLQKKTTTIILFHDPKLPRIINYFRFLTEKYNVISLKEYIHYRKSKNLHKLPEKSIIITLDDGHKGNFNLLPAIKYFNIPVTIFLCSGLINTKRNYWAGFKKLPNSYISYLKKIPDQERLKVLERFGFSEEKNYNFRQALNQEEIIKMKPYVDFQSHSITHPILTKCSFKKAIREIRDSKKELENFLNKSVDVFSYPNGNHGERERYLVENLGYKAAITLDPGYNLSKTNLFKLNRFSINDKASISELTVKVSGFWSFFRLIFKKIIQYFSLRKSINFNEL